MMEFLASIASHPFLIGFATGGGTLGAVAYAIGHIRGHALGWNEAFETLDREPPRYRGNDMVSP